MPSLYEVGRRVSFWGQHLERRCGTIEGKKYSWRFGWLYSIKVNEISWCEHVRERDIWDYVD